MNGDNTEGFQSQFVDGEFVTRSPDSTDSQGEADEHPEPNVKTGYKVEVRSDAIDVNGCLREAADSPGTILEFGSRGHAEAYADYLSSRGGDLRLQAAPENEPRDIHAYLLADHNPSITEPVETNGETWTFDVGANLYGVLGEALLIDPPKSYALVHYVQKDLDLERESLEHGLNVDVKRGRVVSVGDEGAESHWQSEQDRWVPDCIIEARDGWGGDPIERYYCEIKTGDASFERSQVSAMQTLAETERVLKIRVTIDALPDQYSVRVQEVTPD